MSKVELTQEQETKYNELRNDIDRKMKNATKKTIVGSVLSGIAFSWLFGLIIDNSYKLGGYTMAKGMLDSAAGKNETE